MAMESPKAFDTDTLLAWVAIAVAMIGVAIAPDKRWRIAFGVGGSTAAFFAASVVFDAYGVSRAAQLVGAVVLSVIVTIAIWQRVKRWLHATTTEQRVERVERAVFATRHDDKWREKREARAAFFNMKRTVQQLVRRYSIARSEAAPEASTYEGLAMVDFTTGCLATLLELIDLYSGRVVGVTPLVQQLNSGVYRPGDLDNVLARLNEIINKLDGTCP